jgi:putative nucleotidyltransferase with HDIG domain
MPEVTNLAGVEWREGKAHKDNFYHTLEVLDNLCKVSDNIWLRWAALLHDIAKPATKRFFTDVGWTFHGHEVVGERMVPSIFKKLKLPLDHKMEYVAKMVRFHLRPISLTKEEVTDSAVRRLIYDLGEDIEDLLLLCGADITTKNPRKMERYLEGYEYLKERIALVNESDRQRLWQPPIDGTVIMHTFGIPPSKIVGVIKTALREAILDGVIPNEEEATFAFMLKEGEKWGLKQINFQERHLEK